MSSVFSGLSNDYPIRSIEDPLGVQSRTNRVTLKIDVPYTDHSHVIGRGGRNIKSVMLATQCHIHFPDSNRTNLVEKSNQVSISGNISRVDIARQRIRDMLPITFTFELPLSFSIQPSVFRNSPFVRQLEEVYGVDICYRTIHTSPRTRTVVNVKGLSANSRMTKTAVQLLLERYYGPNVLVPITMVMELDATHQTVFFAQKSPEEIAKLVAQTTGALVSFRKSHTCDGSRDIMNSNNFATDLDLLHAFCPYQRSDNRGHAATIEITASTVDNVFLARQLITNLLPVVLLFDVTIEESEYLRKFEFARLQQQYDVSVDIRNKPKQPNRSVVVRTNEKNVRAVYTAWRLIQEFLAKITPSPGMLTPMVEQMSDRYSDAGSELGATPKLIDTSIWNMIGQYTSSCEINKERLTSELNLFKAGTEYEAAPETINFSGLYGLQKEPLSNANRFKYDHNAQLSLNGVGNAINAANYTFGQSNEQLNEFRSGCHENLAARRCPTGLFSMNPYYKPPPRMLRAAAEVANNASVLLSRPPIMD